MHQTPGGCCKLEEKHQITFVWFYLPSCLRVSNTYTTLVPFYRHEVKRLVHLVHINVNALVEPSTLGIISKFTIFPCSWRFLLGKDVVILVQKYAFWRCIFCFIVLFSIWTSDLSIFDKIFKKKKKKDTISPEMYKQAFLEITSRRQNYVQIFTDGLNVYEKVAAAAVTSVASNSPFSRWLRDHCSVYTPELQVL